MSALPTLDDAVSYGDEVLPSLGIQTLPSEYRDELSHTRGWWDSTETGEVYFLVEPDRLVALVTEANLWTSL